MQLSFNGVRNIEVQILKRFKKLNLKLKKMYAEITLDTKILKDVPEKKVLPSWKKTLNVLVKNKLPVVFTMRAGELGSCYKFTFY
jgi:uncharacterized protein (UPF0371 family)